MKNKSKLNIGSKNILYKRLTGNIPAKIKSIKKDIQICLVNHENHWKDLKSMSDPIQNKWYRDCKGNRLDHILKLIDKKILLPLDRFLPSYIHGGVTGQIAKKSGSLVPKSTQSAAISLINGKKGRWLLRIDLKRFYEQVGLEDIVDLFTKRFGCHESVSYLLANLCCTHPGPKSNPDKDKGKLLARGFAPSTRLAIWCNIDFFSKLNKLVKQELKDNSPRIAIYIDDIAITATNVDEERLINLNEKIIELAKKHNLLINLDKTKVHTPSSNKEFVGLKISNDKIFIGNKTSIKRINLLKNIKKQKIGKSKKYIKSLKGINSYETFTKRVSMS